MSIVLGGEPRGDGRVLHDCLLEPRQCGELPERECQDRVLDGLASGGKGSKGRNSLDRDEGVRALIPRKKSCQ